MFSHRELPFLLKSKISTNEFKLTLNISVLSVIVLMKLSQQKLKIVKMETIDAENATVLKEGMYKSYFI